MATVYGVNATKIAAGGIANQCDKGVFDAKLKVMVDTYEAAALANGSDVYMGGTLPAGARVHYVELNWDALCAAVGVANVGDAADADRYIASQQVSTAGTKVASLIAAKDYVVGTASGDNRIIVSVTGGTTFTGTIHMACFYSND